MARNQWISSNPARADWASSCLSFHDDTNSTTTDYRTFRETHSQPINGSGEVTSMEDSGDTLSPPEGILNHLPTGGSQSSGYSSDGVVSNMFTNCTINQYIHCTHGTCGTSSGSFVQDCQLQQSKDTGGHISKTQLLSPIRRAVQTLTPELVDGIDTVLLSPRLISQGLVDTREVEYIMNVHNSRFDKNSLIVQNIPKKGDDALKRFVDCLNESFENPRHPELAQLIRQEVCRLSSSECQDKHGSQRTKSSKCMSRALLTIDDKTSGVKRKRRCSSSNKSSDSTTTGSMEKHHDQHTIPPEYNPFALQPVSTKSGDKSSHGDAQTTNHYGTVPTYAQKGPIVDDNLEDQRLEWLEESVEFTNCSERVMLTSQTSCAEKRKVLHDAILSQDRRPKWLILLSDLLLLLDPHSQKESTSFEWFSDNKYTTVSATPLLLNTLEIKEVKEHPCSLAICFTQTGTRQQCQLQLDACSERARNYCIKIIQRTIQYDRRSRKHCALSTRSSEPKSPNGKPCIVLTVIGVVGITKSGLFCTVRLGRKRPLRTETLKGSGKAHWNHKFEFWDFHINDDLEIRTYQEHHYRPHDLLGSVKIKVLLALCHTDTQREFNLVKDRTTCGKIILCMGLRENEM